MLPYLAPNGCTNKVRHVPQIHAYIEIHHLWPKGWGGPDIEENRISLCGNCHRLVHEILEEAVRNQAWPDKLFLKAFPLVLRGFARLGISKRGGIPEKHAKGIHSLVALHEPEA